MEHVLAAEQSPPELSYLPQRRVTTPSTSRLLMAVVWGALVGLFVYFVLHIVGRLTDPDDIDT